MTANTGPFAPPRFTAEDFSRGDATGRFDEPALERAARPRAPIEESRSFLADDDVRPQSSMARTGLGADPVMGSDPVMEAELDREDEILLDRPVDRSADAFAATPVYAQRKTAKRASTGSKIPVAAMIGVPAVVLLAGVGYMAMTAGSNDAGLSAKAPGEMASTATPAPAFGDGTQVASADVPPPVNPVNPAAPPTATPAPAAQPTERVSAPVRTARARPAPAPVASASSASSEGVDASVTLPAGPQPYSAVGQTSAPAPATAAPAPSAISPAPITVPPVTAAEPVNPTPPAAEPTPAPSASETSETPTP